MEQFKICLKLYYTEIQTCKPRFLYWLGAACVACLYLTMCVCGIGAESNLLYAYSYFFFMLNYRLSIPKFYKIFYTIPLEIKMLQSYLGWRMFFYDMYYLILTVIAFILCCAFGKEWDIWRVAGISLTHSYVSMCGIASGIKQLAGKEKRSLSGKETLIMIWIFIAWICSTVEMAAVVQGVAEKIMLLIGFSGWILVHWMILNQCKKPIVWQDYKEPQPFWRPVVDE